MSAGPTVATMGLSLQVPIAVTMDAVLRDPSWLHHLRAACLTMAGAVLVLAGVVGINLVSSGAVKGGAEEELKSELPVLGQSGSSERAQ